MSSIKENIIIKNSFPITGCILQIATLNYVLKCIYGWIWYKCNNFPFYIHKWIDWITFSSSFALMAL